MEPAIGTPYCGCSESVLAELGNQDMWHHAPVTLAHQMAFPKSNITVEQVTKIFTDVAAAWSSVCGIQLRYQADPAANILARAVFLDGPNGVLGDSYLPRGVNANSQLGQRYDTGENWTLSFLYRVVLHEVGHAIGLSHAPVGSGAVMEPYLTALDRPQPWDIRGLVDRYGPYKPIPTPIPDTPPTGDDLFRGGEFDVPSNSTITIGASGAYLFSFRRTAKANRVKVTLTKR